MELMIVPDGTVRCLYDERIDLHALGHLDITRGSHVEPDQAGQWFVDLSPVGGPRLGPCKQRSHALRLEQTWLVTHWLSAHDGDKMLSIQVTEQEFHTILAALRLYQQHVTDEHHIPGWIRHLARNGNDVAALDSRGIDGLCDRINVSQEGKTEQ